MSKYSQVLFAKTSHKETDIDKVRNEIQKSFDEKLKKIQSTAREENKNTSISIQNIKNEIQDADRKIQEANKKIVKNTHFIDRLQGKILFLITKYDCILFKALLFKVF